VAWHGAQAPSPARADALQAAFTRFVESGMNGEAIAVAKELTKTNSADADLAPVLERISIEARDLDGLSVAHDLFTTDLTGQARGEEFVRQAEVLVSLEVLPEEAIEHGEQALTSVEHAEIEPLLGRLAALTQDASAKVDIYERQVGRCRAVEDRVNALCRAAEVAADLDDVERAQGFFQLALTGVVSDEGLERIVELVRRADARSKTTALRAILAESLANGGQGARDGGRTQSRMLCRAAELAYTELADREQALTWSGDALIQYVDEVTLSALHGLAVRIADYRAAETVVTRALEEVFDGPMVRQLLAYRAELRSAQLSDRGGAAADLKRLHDLLPGDAEVAGRLAALYEELADYRGIIQLYEDQILRSRDQEHRADLAHKVALLWQDRLGDDREAADAWRRVLRLRVGDEEAKGGLARAKERMVGARAQAPSSVRPSEPPPAVIPEIAATEAETTEVVAEVASPGPGLSEAEPEAVAGHANAAPFGEDVASENGLEATAGDTPEPAAAEESDVTDAGSDASDVDDDEFLADAEERTFPGDGGPTDPGLTPAADTLELDVDAEEEEDDLLGAEQAAPPASQTTPGAQPPPRRSLPPSGTGGPASTKSPSAPGSVPTPPRRPPPRRRGDTSSERED
jgi:tetratricopeptide (TPR) repeat protein